MMDDNRFHPNMFGVVIDRHEGCWHKQPDEILKFWCGHLPADDLAFRHKPDTMSVQEAFEYIAHVKGDQLLPQNIPQGLLDAISLHFEEFWTESTMAQGRISPYHNVLITLIIDLYYYHEAYARMDAGEKVSQLDLVHPMVVLNGCYMLRDYLKMEDERRKGLVDKIEPEFTVRNFFSTPERMAHYIQPGANRLH
jgi:hypothetical protein